MGRSFETKKNWVFQKFSLLLGEFEFHQGSMGLPPESGYLFTTFMITWKFRKLNEIANEINFDFPFLFSALLPFQRVPAHKRHTIIIIVISRVDPAKTWKSSTAKRIFSLSLFLPFMWKHFLIFCGAAFRLLAVENAEKLVFPADSHRWADDEKIPAPHCVCMCVIAD